MCRRQDRFRKSLKSSIDPNQATPRKYSFDTFIASGQPQLWSMYAKAHAGWSKEAEQNKMGFCRRSSFAGLLFRALYRNSSKNWSGAAKHNVQFPHALQYLPSSAAIQGDKISHVLVSARRLTRSRGSPLEHSGIPVQIHTFSSLASQRRKTHPRFE